MEKKHPELVKAGLFDKDSDYGGMVGEAVQELLDVFEKQGHSGFSAPHVAGIFYRVVKGELLTPLEDKEDEFMEVGEGIEQNRRCSAVFRNKKGQYYLDAIVWRTQTGSTYTGKTDDISSSQYFDFPFVPKTFYVDVIEEEVAKDDWEFHIKDRKQLEEVFKYYKKQ